MNNMDQMRNLGTEPSFSDPWQNKLQVPVTGF